MVLPNFKTDKNIEANVKQQLENQPMPETRTPSLQPEKPLEIGETGKETAEISIRPETIEIKKEGVIDETIDTLKSRRKVGIPTQASGQKFKWQKPKQIPQVRDKITIQVEKIMETGLSDAYKEMSPTQQQEFKIKGEKTAMEIRDLLRAGKIKIKKIIRLLISWLRLLPGVNKFFLEQEAKIKADKIIALKNFDKQ